MAIDIDKQKLKDLQTQVSWLASYIKTEQRHLRTLAQGLRELESTLEQINDKP